VNQTNDSSLLHNMQVTATTNEGSSNEQTIIKLLSMPSQEGREEVENMPQDSSIQHSQKAGRCHCDRKRADVDLSPEDFALVKGAIDSLIEFSQGEIVIFLI